MQSLRLIQIAVMIVKHIHFLQLTRCHYLFLQHTAHQFINQHIQHTHHPIAQLTINNCDLVALLVLVESSEVFHIHNLNHHRLQHTPYLLLVFLNYIHHLAATARMAQSQLEQSYMA